jgi:hypothetical protein
VLGEGLEVGLALALKDQQDLALGGSIDWIVCRRVG